MFFKKIENYFFILNKYFFGVFNYFDVLILKLIFLKKILF